MAKERPKHRLKQPTRGGTQKRRPFVREAIDQHRSQRVLRCALLVLSEMESDGRRARDAFAPVFAKTPDLHEEERAQIAGSVYAVLRRLRLLDHVIDAGGGLRGNQRNHARLLLSHILDSALDVAVARQHLPELHWERSLARLSEVRAPTPLSPSSPRQVPLGLRWSLDDEIARRLIADFGPSDAEALGRALDGPAAVIARANRLTGTREELAGRLLREAGIKTQPTPLAPDGLVLLGASLPFRTTAFADGAFELQDEGSQLISEVVAPPPRGTVVDACSGSGGKTLHLGALLKNRGRVLAVDLPTPGERRLTELRRRARRAGLDNLEAIEAAPDAPFPNALARLEGRVDRVLVDGPCSGLGVLRRKPEARRRGDAQWLDQLPALQLSILERFSSLVAEGGRLIYATCTVLSAENEGVVTAFLAAHADFERVPIKSYLGRVRAESLGDGTYLKLLPHVHGTDGFFAAVLRRRPLATLKG